MSPLMTGPSSTYQPNNEARSPEMTALHSKEYSMTYPIPTEADRAADALEAAHNEKYHWIVYATIIAAAAENLTWYAAVEGVDPQTWMLERIKAARVQAQEQYPIDLTPFEAADVLEGNATTGFAA